MTDQQDKIVRVLIDGLTQLIQEGKRRDYWCSSRATADALIALDHSLPAGAFTHLRNDARKHLLEESVDKDGERNWNEEVWDTSVACLALSTLTGRKYSNALLQSQGWLLSKYLKAHAWNDEQWETLWALIALSRVPDEADDAKVAPAVKWLLERLDKPKRGMLSNWSNTALFLLFTNRYSNENDPQLISDVSVARENALHAILDKDLTDDPTGETLWTPEGWSNGLVLWAVADTQGRAYTQLNNEKIVKWYSSNIKKLKAEDLAFSCIGLYAYLRQYYLEASGSKESELKEMLNRHLAAIEVKDRPKAVTHNTYPGYLSIHLRHDLLRLALYLSIGTIFAVILLNADNKLGTWSGWLAIIPGLISIGVSIADFRHLLPWSRREGEEEAFGVESDTE